MGFGEPRDRLIVALDLNARDALSMAHDLEGVARWLKIGMTLFYAEGPSIVERLARMGFGIFLDLKLHDIPHQVEGAARSVSRLGIGMLTVHASGGAPMIDAAVRGAARGAEDAGVKRPAILAVTVLTSVDDTALAAVGVERPAPDQVALLARVAKAAGADGVVCSPHEAALVRGVSGERALVVTPGVRSAGTSLDDQSRVATPAMAVSSGASHLVVGRPITGATKPREAAERIVREMQEACG